ncbi:hypothetical protein Y032_0005g2674 [Ancylostoma ceylanicum]|nr:hypothetical protein Y032_0005g2674 [Ancylostoma ceylanicum]
MSSSTNLKQLVEQVWNGPKRQVHNIFSAWKKMKKARMSPVTETDKTKGQLRSGARHDVLCCDFLLQCRRGSWWWSR